MGCYIVGAEGFKGPHRFTCESLTGFAGFPIYFVQTVTDRLCLWWFLKLSLFLISVSSLSCSPAEVVVPRGRSAEFPVELVWYFARGVHFKNLSVFLFQFPVSSGALSFSLSNNLMATATFRLSRSHSLSVSLYRPHSFFSLSYLVDIVSTGPAGVEVFYFKSTCTSFILSSSPFL